MTKERIVESDVYLNNEKFESTFDLWSLVIGQFLAVSYTPSSSPHVPTPKFFVSKLFSVISLLGLEKTADQGW